MSAVASGRGWKDEGGLGWLVLKIASVTALITVGVVGAVGGPAAAGTRVHWATSAPGLAQLAGPDACYAQRDDESENAALCKVGKGLIDAAAPVVSPDGKNVYVAAWGSDAVGVFTRAPATGRVVEIACVSHNATTGVDGTAGQCADGDAMLGATALVVSPDGKNVYIASYASGGIAEFSRDSATGRLRQFGCVRPVETCTGARGLGGASSIAITPDGANVYVAAAGANAISAFVRDSTTGALKGIGCVSDDGTDRMCAKGNALRGASAVTVSPDGRFVYVAAAESSSVLTFTRDAATGQLKQTGCLMDTAPKSGSCTAARGIVGPVALVFSPDGGTLFVASYSSNSVAVLARNRTTGVLSERGCVSNPYGDEKDGCIHVAPLESPTGIAVSPDGYRLYVTGESGLTVFERDRTTGGLRLNGCVSYADYWDDHVTGACQLGRGVAGGTGVTTSPDGRNVYLTASNSDSLASFATGVSTALAVNLPQRRLTVSIACPSSHETPCKGQINLLHYRSLQRPYSLAAGASERLAIRLSSTIVRAAKRHGVSLLVSASDTDRLPVLRRITVGSKPRPHSLRTGHPTGDPATLSWRLLEQSFCTPGSAASWCRYVNGIRITQTTLVGVTTLTSTQQARGAAGHICAALSTIAFATDPRARLTSVRVIGPYNRTLAWRPSLAARCPH